MLRRGEKMWKFPHMEVIRGKRNKLKQDFWQVNKATVINKENTRTNNCFLNTTKHYSCSNGLHDVSWCFMDSLPQNFLMILPPLLFHVWLQNVYFKLWHMKNKGVWQSHASSRNSEAINVWTVERHPPSRRVVACDDYSF